MSRWLYTTQESKDGEEHHHTKKRKGKKVPKGKKGKAYHHHVSTWLAKSRAQWVPTAELHAAGRPSLLKMIPGSHMYRSITRGASMRRMKRQGTTKFSHTKKGRK